MVVLSLNCALKNLNERILSQPQLNTYRNTKGIAHYYDFNHYIRLLNT